MKTTISRCLICAAVLSLVGCGPKAPEGQPQPVTVAPPPKPEPRPQPKPESLESALRHATPAQRLAMLDNNQVLPVDHPTVRRYADLIGKARQIYKTGDGEIAGKAVHFATELRKANIQAYCIDILDATTRIYTDADYDTLSRISRVRTDLAEIGSF